MYGEQQEDNLIIKVQLVPVEMVAVYKEPLLCPHYKYYKLMLEDKEAMPRLLQEERVDLMAVPMVVVNPPLVKLEVVVVVLQIFVKAEQVFQIEYLLVAAVVVQHRVVVTDILVVKVAV